MLLRLQTHTTDAPAAARVFYDYAMQAGMRQEHVTPATIRLELPRQGQPLILPPAHADVLAQLAAVSTILAAVPATSGHRPGHLIPRSEVAGMVTWVLTPLPAARSPEERATLRNRYLRSLNNVDPETVRGKGRGLTIAHLSDAPCPSSSGLWARIYPRGSPWQLPLADSACWGAERDRETGKNKK